MKYIIGLLIVVTAILLAMLLSKKPANQSNQNLVTIFVTCSPDLNKDHPNLGGSLEMQMAKDSSFNESVGEEVLVQVQMSLSHTGGPMKIDVYPKKQITLESFQTKLPDGSLVKIYNCKGVIK